MVMFGILNDSAWEITNSILWLICLVKALISWVDLQKKFKINGWESNQVGKLDI